MYYDLFDNGLLSLDLGLTARDLDTDVTVNGTTITVTSGSTLHETEEAHEASYFTQQLLPPTGKIKTDDIVPMLYFARMLAYH